MSTKQFFFFGFLALAIISFSACESDPCAGKDCGNGICDVDGSCNCDAGYEYGTDGTCTELAEHKFVGNWSVSDPCTDSLYTVNSGHGTSDYDLKLLLTGFAGDTSQGGFIKPVLAEVNGTSISIALQTPDGIEPDKDSTSFLVRGTGSINTSVVPNKMAITYTYFQAKKGIISDSMKCVANFTKK